ncbi:unnamed protein product [Ophioblennius macclurei]
MKTEQFQGGPSWCFRFMKRCRFSIRIRTTVAQQLPVDYDEAGSKDERKRDFEKIFNHYDVTGSKDERKRDFEKIFNHYDVPDMSGPELDKLRAILLRHCDVNKDGKIQRNELALCLGVVTAPGLVVVLQYTGVCVFSLSGLSSLPIT